MFVLFSGEVIENGWPLILTMIGSLEQDHSDILVRSAFQCLQLVFTDFLPAIPYRHESTLELLMKVSLFAYPLKAKLLHILFYTFDQK